MSFNPATAAVNVPASNQGRGNNESWKAQAFLNFYVPAKDGSRKKVGAIALKTSNNVHKTLVDWLNKDPEANLVKLVNRMEFNFQMVDAEGGADLDLEG